MKHRTSELEGALLDAAVVLALGLKGNLRDGRAGCYMVPYDTGPSETNCGDTFEPSTRWAHGGPIIEQDRISLLTMTVNWGASPPAWIANIIGMPQPAGDGPTALIAAMRAYVAHKLGKEVELP